MQYQATRALMTPAAILAIALPAWAQRGPISVPNPMAAHTVFIILITAAFLAWAASSSIQLMRERAGPKKARETLLQVKRSLLDQITKLEMTLESGTITEGQYKRRMKEKRGQLVRVIGKLQAGRKASSRA